MVGYDRRTEQALEARLARVIAESTPLDAAVVLAFDAVHDEQGQRDEAQTHLYVTNDYVMELVERSSPTSVSRDAETLPADLGPASGAMLFGASVHPYRRDALAELERCVRGGAVLMKWLPISQGMNPSHPRCIPFYEALAHYNLPLLCHTGGELSLPRLNDDLADPMLLREALARGVKVIMAHCGTRASPIDRDYLPQFMHLAREHEHCFGDTSALNLPSRWYGYDQILADPVVREKLLHGSDWPILAIPPVGTLGIESTFRLMRDSNWMRRDVRIKQQLGFDDAYWNRAARVLRLNSQRLPQEPEV
jgi:uncharacterized protein